VADKKHISDKKKNGEGDYPMAGADTRKVLLHLAVRAAKEVRTKAKGQTSEGRCSQRRNAFARAGVSSAREGRK